MTPRTLAIGLGAALAVSVAVNVFAAAAAYTALNGQERIEQRIEDRGRDDRRATSREVVDSLSPEVRERVRTRLRAAGLAARPDFQQARELRRQAVSAAAVEPYDAARVAALLDQSRAIERRGRERMEAEALTLMGELSPADRAAFAQILNSKRRNGGRGPSDADKGGAG